MTFDTIKNKTQQLLSIQNKKPVVILGLSGGPDSVFLFFVLKTLHDNRTITLIAAHLDHGWRPDSDKDVEFCKNLCAQHAIHFEYSHIKDLAINPKYNGSQEELGRNYRRHFFATLVQKHTANFIALAHHQQDQQETFFLRLLRGSTLSGLACMNPIDGYYLRPLLHVDKQTILTWLESNNISYLHDPTNTSDNYLRNRIRNHIIPALKLCDDRFDQTFINTLTALKNDHKFLQNLTHEVYQKTFALYRGTWQGSLSEFKALDPHLQKRLLVHWLIQEKVPCTLSSNFIEEIMRFLLHDHGGSHDLNPSWSMCKKKNNFWICKKNS
ncbi:MAG: tRNA lysidine(34) synthetase TilS [bacterium]